MSFARKGEAKDTQSATTTWQGWLDSNQRVRESKSLALPLGYTPISGPEKKKDRTGADGSGPTPYSSGVGNGIRTHDTRNHNPVL